MKTRLKYSKAEGKLVASDLVSNKHNDTLTVTLDVETLTGVISSSTNSTIRILRPSLSLAMLKKQAKAAILEEGVVFLDEIRKKKLDEEVAA